MKNRYNIKRILTVLFKYKLTVITVFTTTVLITLIGTVLTTPYYDASSAIMVNFGREYVYNPEVGDSTPYNYYNRAGTINTEIEILASRDLHEKVLTSIGVNRLYPEVFENTKDKRFGLTSFVDQLKKIVSSSPVLASSPLDMALDKFEYNLSIKGNPQSNVIQVEFQHPDPEIAAKSINRLIELFKEKRLQIFRDPKVYAFLEEKVDEYKSKLNNSETALEDFRARNSVFSFGEQKEILLNQRGQFDQKLKETESNLAANRERLKSLKNQLKKMSSSTALFQETSDRPKVIDDAQSRLLDLRLEEKKLLAMYTDTSPKVQNIRERIEVVEQFLRDQEKTRSGTVRRGKDNAYQEIETDISLAEAEMQGLIAKGKILEKKIEDIDESLLTYAATEKEMRSLDLDRTLNEKNLQEYKEKFEAATVNSEMDRQILTNIRVISFATPPLKPFRPNKVLNLCIGLFLGLLGGLGLAYYKEFLDQGMNSAEEVEELLNLPVLATVSHKPTRI